MKKNSLKLLPIIISLLIIIATIAGLSYAYFLLTIDHSNDASVVFSTKELSLQFVDGPEIFLENALPGQKVIKNFSVTNNGNQTVNYTLEFTNNIYTFQAHDIYYTLTSTNGGVAMEKAIYYGDTNPVIGSTSIAPNITQEYTIIFEYKNNDWDQSYDQGKMFSTVINVTEAVPIYGVKYAVDSGDINYITRTDSSVGLDSYVSGYYEYNSFNNVGPWKDIISYNYDQNTSKRVATYGDANFKFDGSNGLVMTYIPEFYYKRYIDDGYVYLKISSYPVEGFIKSEAFSVSRYLLSYNGTTFESKSGAIPENAHVIDWYRSRINSMGSQYSMLDYHIFFIQMLYMVEYADVYYSNTNLGFGFTTWYESTPLTNMGSGNQFVVNNNYFSVGTPIAFGTNQYFNNVATNRTILAVESYDDGNVTGYLYTFDGDPVDITTSINVHSISQKTGTTDSLGMNSSAYSMIGNSSVSYRGIEDIYGNGWTFVDGVTSNNYIISVCTDHTKYSNDVNNPCNEVTNVEIPHNTGFYNEMAFDSNYPYLLLPSSVNPSTNSRDRIVIGDNQRKVMLYGGTFGGYYHGIFSMGFNISSNYSEANYAASRLIIHE